MPHKLIGCAVVMTILACAVGAQAKSFGSLYSFMGGSDGADPDAKLMRGSAGDLYGTTEQGGAQNVGTVFRLAPDGGESILHSFGAAGDGANPAAGLTEDKHANLYGTTEYGGAYDTGTIFKLAPNGRESVLYSFHDHDDGGEPVAGLIRNAGSLYGTAQAGGAYGHGIVFQLKPDGKLVVLHAFAGGSDGAMPLGSLAADRAGGFYGTTYLGGPDNLGTVFEIAAGGVETTLHAFAGSDGAKPAAGLVRDESGNLYGTTVLGGAYNAGTVFKLAVNGSETVLYSFTGGAEGADPACQLVLDSSGNLYGTTPVSEDDGDGAVFELPPAGQVMVLHSFSGADGADPFAGLIAGRKGHLYGTAPVGGRYGYGVVFAIR